MNFYDMFYELPEYWWKKGENPKSLIDFPQSFFFWGFVNLMKKIPNKLLQALSYCSYNDLK